MPLFKFYKYYFYIAYKSKIRRYNPFPVPDALWVTSLLKMFHLIAASAIISVLVTGKAYAWNFSKITVLTVYGLFSIYDYYCFIYQDRYKEIVKKMAALKKQMAKKNETDHPRLQIFYSRHTSVIDDILLVGIFVLSMYVVLILWLCVPQWQGNQN